MIKVKYTFGNTPIETFTPQEIEVMNQFQTIEVDIRKKYGAKPVSLTLGFETENDARNYITDRSVAIANTGFADIVLSKSSDNSAYSIIITDDQDNVIEVVH